MSSTEYVTPFDVAWYGQVDAHISRLEITVRSIKVRLSAFVVELEQLFSVFICGMNTTYINNVKLKKILYVLSKNFSPFFF